MALNSSSRLVPSSESGDVSAGPGEALHETERDRLVNDGHNDRNRSGRLLRCANDLGSPRYNDIYGEGDKLGGDPGKLADPPLSPSHFDHDGLALYPT